MTTNFKNRSDEWLIQKYLDGHKDALALLIKRYHPKLIRIVRHQIGKSGPVEDIVQECWYSVIKKLSEIEVKISFQAWITGVARNKAVDWIREQKRLKKNSEEFKKNLNDQSETADKSDKKLRKIHAGVQHLSQSQQIVLRLFYLESLSLNEISEVLDLSQGTVKSRLFHAREKLKEIITQQMENEHEKRRNR